MIEQDILKLLGRRITKAEIDDNVLTVMFENNGGFTLSDGGQLCCEDRFVTCDDNPEDLVGGRFLGTELKDAPSSEEEDEDGYYHDQQFVEVKTDQTSITLCTHNKHNGYYGGFCIEIKNLKSEERRKDD